MDRLAHRIGRTLGGLAALAALSLGLSDRAHAATITLTVTADGYVSPLYPDASFADNVLASENGTTNYAGNSYASWLRFDLSQLAGTVATSATLFLTPNYTHSTSGTHDHEIYSTADDAWTSGNVTWNSQLNQSKTLVGTTTFADAQSSGTIAWNVLSAVNGADGLGGTNLLLSLFLAPRAGQTDVFGTHFDSLEIGAPAYIVVETGPAVPEPGTLALALAAVVGGVARRSARWGAERGA